MDMQTALEWLQALPRLAGEPGLDRMLSLIHISEPTRP